VVIGSVLQEIGCKLWTGFTLLRLGVQWVVFVEAVKLTFEIRKVGVICRAAEPVSASQEDFAPSSHFLMKDIAGREDFLYGI
jgi:hypothetical protein